MEASMSERAAVGPGADTPTHLISAAVVGSGAGAPVIVPAPIHPASAVTSWKNPSTCDIAALKSVLHADRKRWWTVTVGLAALACALMVVMMSVGNTVYSPAEVWRVLMGGDAPDNTLRSIWEYRLPRVVAALLVGFAFGIAGNTFQTMLRNPLASPDVIGITSGSSVAAVFCLLVLHMGAGETSAVALVAALAVAAAIYGLSSIGGFSPGRLILVGLGAQAMAKACTSFLLLKGAEFDVASALRWLSGSLNGVTMQEVAPLVAVIPLAVLTLLFGKRLRVLELGTETATTLGASPRTTCVALMLCTVAMIALGTAVTGPIACVTFLAGPIATRLVGSSSRATVPAGLVAVVLIMAADVVGQHFLGTRFPVGVVTGIMGTPYLLYLLVQMNKKGSM